MGLLKGLVSPLRGSRRGGWTVDEGEDGDVEAAFEEGINGRNHSDGKDGVADVEDAGEAANGGSGSGSGSRQRSFVDRGDLESEEEIEAWKGRLLEEGREGSEDGYESEMADYEEDEGRRGNGEDADIDIESVGV